MRSIGQSELNNNNIYLTIFLCKNNLRILNRKIASVGGYSHKK